MASNNGLIDTNAADIATNIDDIERNVNMIRKNEVEIETGKTVDNHGIANNTGFVTLNAIQNGNENHIVSNEGADHI